MLQNQRNIVLFCLKFRKSLYYVYHNRNKVNLLVSKRKHVSLILNEKKSKLFEASQIAARNMKCSCTERFLILLYLIILCTRNVYNYSAGKTFS